MTELPTIAEAAAMFRSGRLTPLDLLEQCLEQIDRYEDRVRAWVLVDRRSARRAAETAHAELRRGEDRGPLHGIPLGIKDIIDMEGLPTRAGSTLRADHIARTDAPLVASLRRAGAVLIGKTVTVEFACFDPSPTRNPWDPTGGHSPGGSSSGSAAAVAMRMCLGAIGTQTGGSLVRPASYCGIAAMKPTFGRIDTQGIIPVSYHLDHPGPMARTIDDLSLMLAALVDDACRSKTSSRSEPAESLSQKGDRHLAITSCSQESLSQLGASPPFGIDSQPPRLGLVETFFMERADDVIQQAVSESIETLRNAGAEITPVSLPDDFTDTLDFHTRIMAVDAAAYHRENFSNHRDAYGPMITGLLDEGLTISGVDFSDALTHQRNFRRRISRLFDTNPIDALIMPSTDTTAPSTLKTTGPKTFQAPWSYAGVPVVSLPIRLTPNGLPVAVQLVASHNADARLLAIARWCERFFDFRASPPNCETSLDG